MRRVRRQSTFFRKIALGGNVFIGSQSIGRVSGGNYVNVTMGANYRHTDRWTFRPEVRWDWSDTKSNDLSVPSVFGDFSENDQFTLSLDGIFTF